MKVLATALLVLMAAFPAAAGDEFGLGLAEMDFSAATEPEPAGLAPDLEADGGSAGERSESLVYRAAMTPRDPSERTLALWNSDLGRVHWALASEQAMLGREGLVHGGRMVGLGLATTAVGDGNPSGLAFALGRGKWAEMNANQKLQTGVEASIVFALLYFMLANAD
jgi:hypothetical protein